MLDRLKRVCNNVKELDPDKITKTVFEIGQIKQKVAISQKSQMSDDGVDSKGDTLGDYSEVSVRVFGKRPGHIQVYETGEFYDSIKVKSENKGVKIEADTIKIRGDHKVDLLTRWPNLLGLDDKSLSEVRDVAQPVYIKEVRQDIFK